MNTIIHSERTVARPMLGWMDAIRFFVRFAEVCAECGEDIMGAPASHDAHVNDPAFVCDEACAGAGVLWWHLVSGQVACDRTPESPIAKLARGWNARAAYDTMADSLPGDVA